MSDFLYHTFPWLREAAGQPYRALFRWQEVPARTVLLREGEPATRLYLLERGCVRAWFAHGDQELTCQFFLEGQRFASLESFTQPAPSLFTFEAIEPSQLYWIAQADLPRLAAHGAFQAELLDFLLSQELHYQREFISFIKHSPTQRYQALLRQRPELVRRVPAQYLASYLGITPVSLSRIKGRLARPQK